MNAKILILVIGATLASCGEIPPVECSAGVLCLEGGPRRNDPIRIDLDGGIQLELLPAPAGLGHPSLCEEGATWDAGELTLPNVVVACGPTSTSVCEELTIILSDEVGPLYPVWPVRTGQVVVATNISTDRALNSVTCRGGDDDQAWSARSLWNTPGPIPPINPTPEPDDPTQDPPPSHPKSSLDGSRQ